MSAVRRSPPAALTLRLVLCPETSACGRGCADELLPEAMRMCLSDICALLSEHEHPAWAAAPWVLPPGDLAVFAVSRAQAVLARRTLAAAGVSAAAVSSRPCPSRPGASGGESADAAEAVACLMEAMLHGGGDPAAARLLACPLMALGKARAHALACDVQAMDRLCDDLRQAADLWQRCGLLPAWRLIMQRSGAAARLGRSRGGRQLQEDCLNLCRRLQGEHGCWRGPAGQYRSLRRRPAGTPPAAAAAAAPDCSTQEAQVCILTPATARGRRHPLVLVPCPVTAGGMVRPAAHTAPADPAAGPGDWRQERHMALRPLLQAALSCAGNICCIYVTIPPPAEQGRGSRSAASAPEAAAAVPGLPPGVELPPALLELAAAHTGILEVSLQSGEPPRSAAAAEADPGPAWDAGGFIHTCSSLTCRLQRSRRPAPSGSPAACASRAAMKAPSDGDGSARAVSRFDFPDTPAGDAFLQRLFRRVHVPSCRIPGHLAAAVSAALEERGLHQAALRGWGDDAQTRSAVLTAWMHDILHARLLQLPVTGGQCLADLGERDLAADMRFCLSITSLTPRELCDLCRSSCLALTRSAGAVRHAAWLQGPGPVLADAAVLRGWISGTLDLVVRLEGGHGPRYFAVSLMSHCLGRQACDYTAPRLLEDQLCPGRRGDLLLMLHSLVLFRHLCQRHGLHSGPARRALYEDQVGGVLYLYLRGLAAGQGDSGILRVRLDFETLQEFDRLCAAGEKRM